MNGMNATSPGASICDVLDSVLGCHNDRIALVDDIEFATFAEIDDRANRLAQTFVARGLSPGDRLAIILPNVIAFIVAEIAALRCGAVKVPLNIRSHLNEVMYSLANCEPTILVCDPNYGRMVAERRAELPFLRAIYVVGQNVDGCDSYGRAVDDGIAARVHHHYRPDDPVLIRYTGGTTGKPKGIVHTNAAYVSAVMDTIREFNIGPSDTSLQLGHLSHGSNFFWPAFFAQGARQILRERFDPKQVLDDFARHRVSFVYMVPTMVHRLLKEDDGTADVSSLRVFMYASAPMPLSVLRPAIGRFGSIFYQVYTLSEAPVITTLMRPQDHVERETSVGLRLASCGRPIETMQLRLLDSEGCEVERGEVGEITVRSVNNMTGYWNLPEQTARTLVDGWVLTGDMARLDEDGFYHLVDRKNDVIITGGFNVYPKEVEDVLYTHLAVSQCAVIGVPDEEWGEVVTAYVVLARGRNVTEDDLIAHCRASLAGYKKPRNVVFVEALPLTAIGKVSRRDLRTQTRA